MMTEQHSESEGPCCPNPSCGEELEPDKDGDLPYYCEYCTVPTGYGVQKSCPMCHTERRKSPKSGKLVNLCRNCNYKYLEQSTSSITPPPKRPGNAFTL